MTALFSPDIYLIRKIPFLEVIRQNFDVNIVNKDYIVQQFDCMLFRLIRNICGKKNYIEQIVFLDCNGARSKTEEIENAVVNGIKINGKRFVITERSASMSRNAILGFISEDIAEEIDKAITMDIKIEKTVLSKYCAYRGLMFSSCHCIENYLPKIIVVPDYEKTLENQMIKYLVDKEIEYVDSKTGENKIWKTNDIETGYKDVGINVFDGFGICHPNISRKISSIIGIEGRVSTFMIRAPFIKGLISEIDYTAYFKEKGIGFIQDIWGKWHSVDEEMIILTASQYKGYKYFKITGTFSDWDYYWSKFKKYNHCLGIAKWNFTKEEEPVYTRANYQILQDLDLCFEDFKTLSRKSIEWADKIVNGDEIYTYCFLGLANDNPKPLNSYAKAILKNKEMLHEQCVRDFLKRQVKKYIDKMKCGKLYIKSCYKFLIPDIIMLLEWIGQRKEPVGALKYNEFWSPGYFGEHAIERNPHICKSEHLVLNAVKNEEIEKYCGHLENVCMLNGYSLSAQRLNGAD